MECKACFRTASGEPVADVRADGFGNWYAASGPYAGQPVFPTELSLRAPRPAVEPTASPDSDRPCDH
jgi:hypothetical protein